MICKNRFVKNVAPPEIDIGLTLFPQFPPKRPDAPIYWAHQSRVMVGGFAPVADLAAALCSGAWVDVNVADHKWCGAVQNGLKIMKSQCGGHINTVKHHLWH